MRSLNRRSPKTIQGVYIHSIRTTASIQVGHLANSSAYPTHTISSTIPNRSLLSIALSMHCFLLSYSKLLQKLPDIIAEDEGLPELQDADEIIARHFVQLREHHFSGVWGYEATEDDDWSGLLWNLIHICFEAGLTTEETYSVASASTLNKYRRDNRPARYLWRDVTKAAKLQEGLNAFSRPFDMPELIPGERYKLGQRTFVEEYAAWGREATDACPQYHDLTAFMLLSRSEEHSSE